MKIQLFFAVFLLIFFIGTKTFAAGIEITDDRAKADYWTSRAVDGDKLLFTYKQIELLNSQMIGRDDYAANLANYPKSLSAEYLKKRIERITQDVRLEGSAADRENRNLDALKGNIAVTYAVTTERVNVRILPHRPTGDKYDELQGTALDPAEAVAVLWESKDGKFSFVQARYYFGWVAKESLAFTNYQKWLTYVSPENFVVVINNKKFVNVNGKVIRFQMGAKIPVEKSELENNSWTARLPFIENGEFKEFSAKVLNDGNVSADFLQPTTNNFINQSFKFLGDVYGWGGLDNSVDCSAFVQNIYRSMGIYIPRDADRQSKYMPIFAVFNNVSDSERLDIVKRAPSGSLIFKPGHVMMKLGNDDKGSPVVIHAASSYFSGGQKIYIRKVLVSVLDYKNDYGAYTLDNLTDIGFPN